MNALDWAEADKAMQQAVTYLREGGATKVGTIGFCMGGALTLIAAAHAKVDAAVPCYGLPIQLPEPKPEDVLLPTLYVFGDKDTHKNFSAPEDVTAWVARVKAAGGDATLGLYEDAGHSFLNIGEEATASRATLGFFEPSRETQDRAWADIYAFLDKHLKN